jgi:hypothetical protein
VLTVYLDIASVTSAKGISYSRVLLRSSFREHGKVKHRTLGNLSDCSPGEIEAVRLALQHTGHLAALLAQQTAPCGPPPALGDGDGHFKQGPSLGAVAVLRGIAQDLGITAALGDDTAGRLALWQVIARALDQGSRLSAVRLARDLGAGSLLGLPGFNEDVLYDNLAWLQDRQESIEQSLFDRHYAAHKPSLYLYDVTSTYLEGEHNALAAFGYNRDGKRGKKQIVVGLLCDESGVPVAIEAFKGNTPDPKTVGSQIAKLQQRFHAANITLVGDRGMLRGPQLEALSAVGLHYITAISKPQIETLLASGTLQMELFDQALGEVIVPSAVTQAPGARSASGAPMERYIMRRNPVRQAEMAQCRASKAEALARSVGEANTYLMEHPRAKPATALRRIEKRLGSLGLCNWMKVVCTGRELTLVSDQDALEEESKLDGCYVLRTDLEVAQASKESVHERYKSLAEVEQAFRRSKTVELEMRPVHVRKEQSTRGHLLVVMLAYQIMKELGRRWAHLDLTVNEGLERLNTYCAVEVAGVVKVLLQPRADVQELLDAARVSLPTQLPVVRPKVATKKKLPNHRPTRKK